MMTFSEFLNDKPTELKQAWEHVQQVWKQYLHTLHEHMQGNMNKYDSHHAKFGTLTNEHPDLRVENVVRGINKKFQEMDEVISSLGAHEMI